MKSFFFLFGMVVTSSICGYGVGLIFVASHYGFAEWVSAGADTVLAGAALGGLFAAIAGYQAWKRELHGRGEYELCRKLLNHATNLYFYGYEKRLPHAFLKGKSPEEAYEDFRKKPSLVDIVFMYNESFPLEQIESMQILLLEARAYWKEESFKDFYEFIKINQRLFGSRNKVRFSPHSSLESDVTRKEFLELWPIVCAPEGATPDPFGAEYKAIYENIKAALIKEMNS